jgi:2-keto-4-pentenoate hydratase
MRRRDLGFVLAFLAGAGVLAAVAAVAGWWNGTSSPVILNTVRVERSIEASILSQRHLASTVSCPVNIVQKAGVVFDCVATVRGRQFPVVVTETDSNGHVVYVVT